ncbi:chlorohydrolase [Streptococcus pneumoniae]|nr:chlorohydrolase [Streptococcus pneumoniae]
MTQYPFFYFENLYSMKIKEQTRQLLRVAQNTVLRLWIELTKVSSKHCFEVADRTDEVSNIYTAR